MAGPHIPTTLAEWLDDLTVEEAQWFYEDFVRPAVAASGAIPLPSLPLRQFFLLLFQHCPLLSGFTDTQHIAAYEDFLAYKVRIPVRGAILMDHSMEKVLLVRGWKKGASWSFPRGKINKDERDLDCAVREVYEETGFDLHQAGLIPANDGDVKHIDITMREQHLRLFVFRGVPENTHFEPRTRKEIGKIEWYNVRDLPGFKKQKSGGNVAEGDVTHASRFYMVAPFLGQLKKWIGHQRKQDAAQLSERLPSDVIQNAFVTEDEGDTEDYGAGVDPKSEELKKLLSIGGSAVDPTTNSTMAQPDAGASSLLAMLQGDNRQPITYNQPKTPYDQINTFAQQPETPNPQHLRNPSAWNQQGPSPQFPLSPQRLQQDQFGLHEGLQRSSMANIPNAVQHGYHWKSHSFGPEPTQTPMQQQPLSYLPMPSNHGFNATQSQQSQIPFNANMASQAQQQGPHRHMSLQPQREGPIQMASSSDPQELRQNQPQIWLSQGIGGPLGSGNAVPNASQLPAPKLSAHSLKLLDTFKGEGKSSTAAASARHQPTQSNNHQTALLDLFKKPLAAEPQQAATTITQAMPSKPAFIQPMGQVREPLEKKATLNEITRTLPTTVSRKQSLSAAQSSHPSPSLSKLSSPVEMFGSEPLPVQSNPNAKPQRAYEGTPREDSDVLASPVTILKSPRSKQTSRTQNVDADRPSDQPRRHQVVASPDDHRPRPIKTLSRPGSSRDPKSSVSSNSFQQQTNNLSFQPQVLKRPTSTDTTETSPVTVVDNSTEKRNQLLSLFGATPISPQPPPSAPATQRTPAPLSAPSPSPISPQTTAPRQEDQKANLLDLFTSNRGALEQQTQQQQHQEATAALKPPPAPKIGPERTPSTRAIKPIKTTSQSQSLLLDLFHKQPPLPGISTSTSTSTVAGASNSNNNNKTNIITSPTTIASPTTPISPFVLGTPITTTSTSTTAATTSTSALKHQDLLFQNSHLDPSTRSRLGNINSSPSSASASAFASGPSSTAGAGIGSSSSGGGPGTGPGAETPKETKDFLMGFLNGVVQREGGRR